MKVRLPERDVSNLNVHEEKKLPSSKGSASPSMMSILPLHLLRHFKAVVPMLVIIMKRRTRRLLRTAGNLFDVSAFYEKAFNPEVRSTC
jgi:hypothetical protein